MHPTARLGLDAGSPPCVSDERTVAFILVFFRKDTWDGDERYTATSELDLGGEMEGRAEKI